MSLQSFGRKPHGYRAEMLQSVSSRRVCRRPPTCPENETASERVASIGGLVKGKLIAGRARGEVYRVIGKSDLYDFLIGAVERSGGHLLYASDPGHAPIFLTAQLDSDERIGMLIYPFRITRKRTRNRPTDEIRGQLRYGSEDSWKRIHPIGRDIAGVDVTLIVGIDIDDGILVGLDSSLWDPLPMGISFYAKLADIELAQNTGWHVWEKENRPGTKRINSRSPSHLETAVAFRPDRLVDYARLERRATTLRLDPPLRFAAATAMATSIPANEPSERHDLEAKFELSSQQILDIIGGRNRLAVAVRGGVAEYHLEQLLLNHRDVTHVERLDIDAMHDFNVVFTSGQELRIECKNASPKALADGTFKVEVQKTRGSKNDPASRFYPVDAFDVVAACLFSPTGRWEFRFGRTSRMKPHKQFGDRLAAVQSITAQWAAELTDIVD